MKHFGLILLFATISSYLVASSFQVNPQIISLTNKGGISVIRVSMSGRGWTCSSNQPWCNTSKKSSSKPVDQVIISADANPGKQSRSAQLLFVMDSADTVHVLVLQTVKKSLYPNYSNSIPPDSSRMPHDAKALASRMFAGWNLGNSLEIPYDETKW